jgi:hypothetical protein
MFLEGALGSRVKTDKLKLSDFIDESFFEEIADDGESSVATPKHNNANQAGTQLKPLEDLFKELRQEAL